MNDERFLELVREDLATELHRLGSDKYLIAATGADLTETAVLATVARTAVSGRETFDRWAESETGPAAETFGAAAETERDHLDLLGERLDETPDDPGDDAVHAVLGEAETTVARAGAMIGRGLVADRARLQVVNFFVNEVDPAGADLARELRSDVNDQVTAGADLLEDVCESEDDWEVARAHAERVVEDAYDEYASALEAMGVDPKPVC
jgi:hypothetical protein